MTAARLKRIAALEARQPRGRPNFDPGPAAIALLQWFVANHEAIETAKACRLPAPELEPESSWSPAMFEAMRHFDRLAARLATEAEREAAQ